MCSSLNLQTLLTKQHYGIEVLNFVKHANRKHLMWSAIFIFHTISRYHFFFSIDIYSISHEICALVILLIRSSYSWSRRQTISGNHLQHVMIERLQNSRGYLSIHMTYMRTCQKQESRARTSDYIIQHLRNIMARPYQNTCIWLLNPYTETYKRVVKLYTNILATYQNHAKRLHLYYPSVFHKDTENYTYEKNMYTPTISCDLKMSSFFILEMSKLKKWI